MDVNEFYFESDFYLLKNNKDYQNLLKSLAILEVQRSVIIQNIENIVKLKDDISNNPLGIFKKIVKRKDVKGINLLKVEEVPFINWSNYYTNEENEQSKQQIHDINLRYKNLSRKMESQNNVMNEVEKPETFNKPWTVEEQLRLEELLVEYPPERNESNRYRKIAEALGTRNLRQVCSRVQKYNIKMKKVGQIKSINSNSKNLNKKTVFLSHKNIGALLKPTTFIPSTTLSDDVDVYNINQNNITLHEKTEINKQTKLYILKHILNDKQSNTKDLVIHKNIKCSVCQLSPILGIRWNCVDCPAIGRKSDFCNDCIVDILRNIVKENIHPLDHTVIPIKQIKEDEDNIDSLVDPSYVPLVFQTQNYLDPNFMVQN
ncbi:ZZ-type zinc finger-containing protein 3 [Daktulosphaira vitifoliae]|uniref:ZZ-type zinc finger-containing protein 3 n=1 Tax=Daktulosphaira vitifoliae TaxID=58002 RepID=UPI0021AA2349|nr:ZZ-type zinc finger-containing protein 3 [Daktulosphaira vitifoliae]